MDVVDSDASFKCSETKWIDVKGLPLQGASFGGELWAASHPELPEFSNVT
jgi:hypothetical protein